MLVLFSFFCPFFIRLNCSSGNCRLAGEIHPNCQDKPRSRTKITFLIVWTCQDTVIDTLKHLRLGGFEESQ